MYAAMFGKLEVAKLLISHEAEVEDMADDGRTPLILAAGMNHLSMCKLLLQHDIDVNETDGNGFTALM